MQINNEIVIDRFVRKVADFFVVIISLRKNSIQYNRTVRTTTYNSS